MTTIKTQLTELEKQVLEGINNSDYGDELGSQIWAWSCKCPIAETKQISGVISSLVKKGLVEGQDEGDDATIWLTELGIYVCREENLLGRYK